jgi:hypothetical protein
MAKVIKLTENDLRLIIKRVINEQNEATIAQYKQIFVNSGKIDEDVYDEIVAAAKGKGAYIKWLCSRVAEKKILAEDVYKYEDYLNSFDEAKKSNAGKKFFNILDINQIKSSSDVRDFEKSAIAFKEKGIEFNMDDNLADSKNLVSKNDLLKLDAAGIKLIGIVDGYQIFKITDPSKETHKAYCDLSILFRAQKNAEVKFCTFGYGHYSRYLKDYPGSAYYFIFNLGDPMAPYQFHYESNQFKNRTDQEIF